MVFNTPLIRYREEDAGEEKEKRPAGDLAAKLLKTRTIMVADEVNKKMAQQIMSQLILMEAENDDDIKMYINSPGGDADAGFAIYDMMRFIRPKVKAICVCVAASAAVIILLGAKRENRFSLPNARVLIHQPSTGIHGTAADIQIEAIEILKCREKINRMIATETGQTMEKVGLDTKRNLWMSAEDALKYGLVSKIIQTSSDLTW